MLCGAPTRTGGQSWLNVRSDQKYKSEENYQEETRGKATKRTVARAKPKRTPVKKAAWKERMKQPVAPVVETVAVEVIEQPAPSVMTVTEAEETRKAS